MLQTLLLPPLAGTGTAEAPAAQAQSKLFSPHNSKQYVAVFEGKKIKPPVNVEGRFYSPYERRWDSTSQSNFNPGIPLTEVSVALRGIGFFSFCNLAALAINCIKFDPLCKFTSRTVT